METTTKILRDHIRRLTLLHRRLTGLERAIVGEQIKRLQAELARVETQKRRPSFDLGAEPQSRTTKGQLK